MEYVDMGLTAVIVVAAFIYMIRHFMPGNKGCISCTGCSKAGNCTHGPQPSMGHNKNMERVNVSHH
ncbi:hypothetical protein SAMN02746065_13028 [Desulfocicer vacuolatum DSM 3385]|uniref:Virus attachment protein p12 family protein n=1 Tax=Desulfocicer vacuolatum DSM 3385 TaxID=1121400 RepID=A0A1W2EF31_9BACT|nr:hypothetical protein [Desulfocicer vacuolatum]SMD08331.1 hypothetical protein SAMN02746065_13028 [Desulfocicer vacuolatum DSM 3385]